MCASVLGRRPSRTRDVRKDERLQLNAEPGGFGFFYG